ncbi:NAD(P)H-dependent oxidoreductase [Brachybacterium sp. GPGPB12]|uniref:NAD(P)H-dependent oxidoreductase n=1 Tax=Brachybacterium sp. GPGPB12 TaxID=3023517 RepID=UPI00313437B7
MLADQLTREASAALGADGSAVEVTTVEPREYAHDLTDAPLTRFPSERLSTAREKVRAADAVIAVTPIFNAGPAGLFKTFFDALDIELWKDKPVFARRDRRHRPPLPRDRLRGPPDVRLPEGGSRADLRVRGLGGLRRGHRGPGRRATARGAGASRGR